MIFRKKKVLLLSTHDSHLMGHAWSCMQLYDKERYEVGLVSLYSLYNDKTHAIIPNIYIYRIFIKIISFIEKLFVKSNEKYCFSNIFSFPVTANQILRKYTLGKPDIILLHWYDGFITPKVLKQLYEKTLAKIVFVFTDEYPLGGGCHYPCECLGYQTQCTNCPALLNFKCIAERKLNQKLRLLGYVPKVVIAPSAGIEQAQKSAFFKQNTEFVKTFRGCEISNVPSFEEARRKLNIHDDAFVIMFGALNINEERKGMSYLLEALEFVSENIDHKIIALVAGKAESTFKELRNIEYRYMGTVSLEQLYEVYSASNVYISPSIADAGPMMVMFSIACGTPVVAFPVGFALDVIKHKETGFLARKFSSQSLAEGILYFYSNQIRRKEFSDKCLITNQEALKSESVYNSL